MWNLMSYIVANIQTQIQEMTKKIEQDKEFFKAAKETHTELKNSEASLQQQLLKLK